MECGLGFTEPELVVIRLALTSGLVGVVTLSLAFMTKLVRGWLEWRR
jgi:hypothetical protein